MIGRIVLAVGAAALVASSPASPQASGGCAPPSAGVLKIDGVTAQVDEITYASPRSSLRLEGAVNAAWYVNGAMVDAASLPAAWASGQQDILITAPDGCGQPARVAETRFVVDAVAPQLSWKVVEGKTLDGKVPDQGRDKRYLWWWFQPEKHRLVWSDGETAWNVLRQYPETRVATSPTRTTLYVWAPDANPFDGSEGQNIRLDSDRVLVIEAADASSGVAGVQIHVVADTSSGQSPSRLDGARRDVKERLKLVASAVDRVGNSTEVELPYRTRD